MTPKEKLGLNWHEWFKEMLGGQVDEKFFEGSDWLIAIKLHALIETGLNESITNRLGVEALREPISKLNTSDPRAGKIAFAKKLGILSDKSHKFLQTLSELRNFCVHNIRNFNLSLVEYVKPTGDKKADSIKSNFLNAMVGINLPANLSEKEAKTESADCLALYKQDPRSALIMSGLTVLLEIYQAEATTRQVYQAPSEPPESSPKGL